MKQLRRSQVVALILLECTLSPLMAIVYLCTHDPHIKLFLAMNCFLQVAILNPFFSFIEKKQDETP